jgi:RNA polymerase sigma-70 factor (ECF subfamily)
VAWNEFVSRYSPKMRRFSYDPTRSFRSWLKTLTQHAWSDFVAARLRAVGATSDSQTLQALGTLEARQDLETRLEEAIDLELMELATLRVRQQVEPRTCEAFRLTALDGWSGADAAALGLSSFPLRMQGIPGPGLLRWTCGWRRRSARACPMP